MWGRATVPAVEVAKELVLLWVDCRALEYSPASDPGTWGRDAAFLSLLLPGVKAEKHSGCFQPGSMGWWCDGVVVQARGPEWGSMGVLVMVVSEREAP